MKQSNYSRLREMRSKQISQIYKKKKEKRKIFTNRSKAVPGFTCFNADKLTQKSV